MATRNLTTKIQMRHDISTNWESKNPILDVGEIGYDEDRKQIKIGDGIKNWNSLSWQGENTFISSTQPTGKTGAIWINSSTGVVKYWNGTAWANIFGVFA